MKQFKIENSTGFPNRLLGYFYVPMARVEEAIFFDV